MDLTKLTDKFSSRKLILTVGAVLLAGLNDKLGLGMSQDAVNQVVAAICAYVIGQGIADFGSKKDTTVKTVATKGKKTLNG